MRSAGTAIAILVVCCSAFASARAYAADIQADPSNYKNLIPTLHPGDTLHLAAGDYAHVSLSGLNGAKDAWITITGPLSGAAATFHADPGPCCNTIEISDASYLGLKNVTIDGGHVDGAFGISAAGGVVHDILIEGCTLINHDAGQQTDGISTKVPTWGWIIRRNRIVGVGTGLYLGNSDGSDPFVGGLIENNLVQDPIGYCMEIKWQAPRANVAGMPSGPSTTIVRNNVFIKNDGPSDSGDRPNVLVGGFPDTGPGADDRYEIYGNFFFHNPRESLLQASGRVTIHDNVFVDSAVDAITLQNHDLPLKQAYVYNNTVYGTAVGIHFGSTAPQGSIVAGNLVFAGAPITGTIADNRDNLTPPMGEASSFVKAPSKILGDMDFYPLPGKCEGAAMDASMFVMDTDYDIDFNGTAKGNFTFRGAYARDGANPGWKLDAGVKTSIGGAPPAIGGASNAGGREPDSGSDGPSSGGSANTSGGTISGSGGSGNGGNRKVVDGGGTIGGGGSAIDAGRGGDAGPKTRGTAQSGGSGCGCRAASREPSRMHGLAALLLASLLFGRARRGSITR